jgi:hypothetical protein
MNPKHASKLKLKPQSKVNNKNAQFFRCTSLSKSVRVEKEAKEWVQSRTLRE